MRVPLGLDHPYWVEDPGFDVRFHIWLSALAQPGDWEQLWLHTARSCTRALDSSPPLWELEVIEGLGNMDGLPDGSFASLLKVHHAAVDGPSGIEILTAIHDPTAVAVSLVTDGPWVLAEVQPSAARLLGRTGINAARKPAQLARTLTRAMPRMRSVAKGVKGEGLSVPPRQAPPTRFNGPISARRAFVGRRVSLAAVKQVKAAVSGTTVNDVALAVVGGALRRYLSAKGELPAASLSLWHPSRSGPSSKGERPGIRFRR